MLKAILKRKRMSIYRLSKESGVPYATLNDICSKKTSLKKCTAETVYRISKTLGVGVEDLLAPYMVKRPSFENYKSAICHRIKEKGDFAFIRDVLVDDEVRTLFDAEWYPESFYLLAMIDYLCRENNLPICEDYDDLRSRQLTKKIYPQSLRLESLIMKDPSILQRAEREAIPEFLAFNIVENEVRSVV